MDLDATTWTATLLAIGLVVVPATPAGATTSDADTCALIGADASDLSLAADPIREDGTCFGSLFRRPADDMQDWYRRSVQPGDDTEQIDVSACADGDGEDVVVQLYFVASADPVPVPGPEDRVGIETAPSGSCSDFIRHELSELQQETGGTWYVTLSSAPDAGYALMTSVF